MAQIVLPNSVNYDEQLPSLISGVNNYTQVLQPSNGSAFKQNNQINIDIPSRGFIDPKSCYIRYKNKYTSGAGFVCSCPLFTPILRLDTYINSVLVDTISDYNKVANDWINLNLGPNEKMAIQSAWGYDVSDGNITKFDGRTLSAGTTTFPVAGPLVGCLLTSCEKMIPAFCMAGIRLVFTLDSYTNMCSNGTLPTDYDLNNFEFVYDLIDFGSQIEQEIMSRQNIVIKSNSHNLSSLTVPVGTSGNNTYVFNQRFASIRNAIVSTTCSTSTLTLNGKYDSVDLTSFTDSKNYGGSYSISCGGIQFPQGAPLNTLNNRAGLLQELRKAIGNLYSWEKSMSIDATEFSYAESGAGNGTTTAYQNAKFFVGFDLNKINSASNMMLNGTSSQNSPINVIVQSTQQTANSHQLCLMLNYDAIITIDPRTKQVSILQ